GPGQRHFQACRNNCSAGCKSSHPPLLPPPVADNAGKAGLLLPLDRRIQDLDTLAPDKSGFLLLTPSSHSLPVAPCIFRCPHISSRDRNNECTPLPPTRWKAACRDEHSESRPRRAPRSHRGKA